MRVIIGAVVVAAISSLSLFASTRTIRIGVAADHFYDALTALNSKDYKTAEVRASRQLAPVRLRQAVPGSLCRFYVASAYMAERKPAQARDALERPTSPIATTSPKFKNLALVQLGVAYEILRRLQKRLTTHMLELLPFPARSEEAQNSAPRRISAEFGDRQRRRCTAWQSNFLS